MSTKDRFHYDPMTGEWNDSQTGNFIWTNVNVGEAVSNVMTPLTWSIFQHSFSDLTFIPGYNIVGNICGRIYSNGSVSIALLRLSGRNPREFANELGGGYEQFEAWIEKSKLEIPLKSTPALIRNLIRFTQKQKHAIRQVDAYLAKTPKWCQEMRGRLDSIRTGSELADYWEYDLATYGMDGFWIVFSSAVQYSDMVGKLRRDLTRLIGKEDTSFLLSCVSTEQDLLSSLGLVVGAWRVHRGEWTREYFLEQYGHRGPFEDRWLSPCSVNGTEWLDELLDSYTNSTVDVDALLANRRAEYEAASLRLRTRYPQPAKKLVQRLKLAAEAARQREAVRSEFMRITFVITHPCVLKAGEITGLGNDIFFLTYQEIWDLLRGISTEAPQHIPVRKSAYERQRAMPPYPPVIRGQFDPVKWLANPNKHKGYFDSHEVEAKEPVGQNSVIKGMPGSVGQVEGLVRRVYKVEDANQLQQGEILVTTQTHIGWTPYFPRLSAVITDVGAPLSHAAIVARELGIPAVVGCRDATLKLKTGDRVRVDGGAGTVTVGTV
ncbi:MAG TPA: PEP-utilizing enzyme [Anaerolineales bacterium]|nr:PEP-utilizing enzyme [Anaerolineales bacterium]